jgi:hypothetical protein
MLYNFCCQKKFTRKAVSMTVAEITRQTRSRQELSTDKFAAALVEQIPGKTLTRQAVNLWEVGRTVPDLKFLILAASQYSDWRACWAQDCLNALMPEVFTASSIADGGVNITATHNSETIGNVSGCGDGNQTQTITEQR